MASGNESDVLSGERRVGDRRAEIFELLSNERRRGAIHYLAHRDCPVMVEQLVDAVYEWERPDTASRASVYSTLVQTHLPRLEEAGVVEFDRERNVVEPTDEFEAIRPYLTDSKERSIGWPEYYLALAAVSIALLVVTWLGVSPFAVLDWLTVAALVIVVFFVSSVAHTLQS